MYPVEVNYLAALVSAVLAFLLGAVWYGKLFARPWMDAQGFTQDDLHETPREMGKTYAMTFISYLFMAVVLAILIDLVDPPDVGRGLWLASLVWFGFMVPATLTGVLFSRAKFRLFYIDGAYQLASALVMGAILTAWQ
jgi:hypothetical protein